MKRPPSGGLFYALDFMGWGVKNQHLLTWGFKVEGAF